MNRNRVKGNLAMSESAMDGDTAGKKQVFLERWKARARAREVKLSEQLLARPLSPKQLRMVRMWLVTIEGRRTWLDARLEHTQSIERILSAAVKNSSRSE
jgi:hypothetical protein